MIEFFKNFEPFCMNFRKFSYHVYGFRRFEDASSIQIASVVAIKILKTLPICQKILSILSYKEATYSQITKDPELLHYPTA